MDNKKHIVNLESFKEMLHICRRLPGQSLVKPPFEEKILAFLWFLRHSGVIRRLTDVNINKLHQPWRSFAAIINKCLTGKSSGYDSLWLSQAQILCGLYHKRNVDFAYLMWEDFVYQVEHKDIKKSNEMYYPRFTKFGALLPIKLTNEDIRNSNAYKEYYAVATGATPPKPKAEVVSTQQSLLQLLLQAQDCSNDRGEEISWNSTDEEGDDNDDDEGDDGDDGEEGNDDGDAQEDDDQEDKGNDEDDQEGDSDDEQASDEEEFIHPSLSTHAEEKTRDGESFDPIPKTPKNTDDEGNGKENLGMNVGRKEGQDEEDEADELYRDVNINLGRGIQMADVHTTQEVEDSHVTLTLVNPDGQQQSSSTPTSVAPLPMSAPTLTPSTIATITTTLQAPTPLKTAPSTLLQDLPNFGSLFGFDHRLKTLEANFSEFTQTNQFAGAVSLIPDIIHRYMDQQMNETVKTVNEQLEAEVLTRSSNSSKTSYAVAADLLEMELKKILIEKMEDNKSIHRSNKQRNLYKALVEANKSDKIILDIYGDTVTLKRRRDDDADKDEEPSAGLDRGPRDVEKERSQSQQALHRRKLPGALASQHKGLNLDKRADDQPIVKPSQHPEWFSQQKKPPTLDRDWNKTLPANHGSIQPWISDLAKQSDSRSSFNELMDTPVNPEGQQYPHNLLKPLPLIPNSRGRRVIPFDHFVNNDLEYLRGGASSCKYTTSVTKTKAADYMHIKWIEDLVPRTMWIQEPIGYDKHALWGISHWGRKHQQFYDFAINRESARDVYSKRRIITVTELKIVERHNYKHLDWIMVCRDDDKLYKFKEGDFKRLRIQDIKDMLLLLVQGKLTNLTVEERFAFNVSLRMFIRSIVIQRRAEDLQLGVESYQKKLSLTRPDSYRSDLKRTEAYIAYLNPRGFIYQNKDKQNMLMRVNELHKFSDGTLTDVRTALDDRLKGIRMKYLPQTIWWKSDKERAATMIQAIDKSRVSSS
nr:hypothetical protein [Tanacetum cinerariifolium]